MDKKSKMKLLIVKQEVKETKLKEFEQGTDWETAFNEYKEMQEKSDSKDLVLKIVEDESND